MFLKALNGKGRIKSIRIILVFACSFIIYLPQSIADVQSDHKRGDTSTSPFAFFDEQLQAEKKVYLRLESMPEKYTQEFEIIFKNEEAAQKAVITIVPLYNDYTWAISSRWDDNNTGNIKMRDVLNKHGHKATWYLNSVLRNRKFTEVTARQLLEGGHSIGGHSLTHPFLTYVNRNRIFEEVAGIRIEWEALVDTSIVSYAFSNCNFRNDMEADDVQIDITKALERAGYYSIANGWYHANLKTDMILSPIAPWDGKEIETFAQMALGSEAFRKAHPNISFAMHVWYKTAEQWNKFESQLQKYGKNPDWWYCNQNQYAAYRYQLLLTEVCSITKTSNTVKCKIQRPSLLQVNDTTPLTFQIKNVERRDIISVKCSTADCQISDRITESPNMHLYHDKNQKLPEIIGKIDNENNRKFLTESDQAPEFPGLSALLYFDNSRLCLDIQNKTEQPITDVRLVFRFPLAWEPGLIREKIKQIPPDTVLNKTVMSKRLHSGCKYMAGMDFFAAQMDFISNGRSGRIHTTCKLKNNLSDDSCPQGRFLTFGPIPKEKFNIEEFIALIKNKMTPVDSLKLTDGTSLQPFCDCNDNPFAKPYLGVEIIRTYGNQLCKHALYYIMQSFINSPKQQDIKFAYDPKTLAHIFLNGVEVLEGHAELSKGSNLCVLIYQTRFDPDNWMSAWYQEHMGCFLRIAGRDSNKRLENISFQPVDFHQK